MKTKITLTVFFGICFFAISKVANAQQNEPMVTVAKYFDVTPPLRDMTPVAPKPRDKSWKKAILDNGKWIENKENERPNAPADNLPPRQTTMGTATATGVLKNFEGVGCLNNVYPPDPNGDIGGLYYIDQVNSSFSVYNREGVTVYGPVDNSTIWSGFIGSWTGTNDGDGIVLYDEFADCWFFSQFAFRTSDTSFWQLIAISTTNDPTGSWYRYAFEFTELNDYPKFGVWPDGYYASFNMPSSAYVAVFERSKMLTGDGTARMLTFRQNNLWGFKPADCDGVPPPPGTPNYFSRCYDNNWGGTSDGIKIWEFHTDWVNTANTTFEQVADFAAGPFNCVICETGRWTCMQQPGTNQKLEALSGQLMNRLQYRNFGNYKTLVTNQTTKIDSCKAGIQWYEMRNEGSGWYLYQQGTYAPDNNYRWNGSMAMNAMGDIGLAYTVSGTGIYPSIRFTGRRNGDPLGQMTIAETTVIAGGGSQFGGARWGDYSNLSIDPVDNVTFWHTNEYIQTNTTTTWNTRVASFSLSAGPYCQAGSMDPNNEYINYVQIGTISHGSLNSPFGYGDYKTISTAIPRGSPSTITVTIGNPGYYSYGGIWVDWNNDGDFEDASEEISPIGGSPGTGPYTAQITPPLSTLEGNVVLRVRVNYMNAPEPCGVTTYGEVEDYTLSLTEPTVNVWRGEYSGYWEQANNWSLGHVPVATENVLIPSSFNSPWLHSITAECNNITINPGVLFDIYDGSLHVAGNMTMYGQLMMEHAAAELSVDGNITWGSGSTANIYAYTNINIAGNWTFAPGSNVQLTNGAVTFTGNSPSIIYCNGTNSSFNYLNINKDASHVILDGTSTANLTLNGSFIIYGNSSFYGYSNHKIILKSSLNAIGGIYLSVGTMEFNGGFLAMQVPSGSFFRNLTINSSVGVFMDSDIEIRGDLLIQAGTFYCNAHYITISGNWTNTVGDIGFDETNGLVIFNGSAHQYCGSETFNALEINKPSGAFRVWASIVNCNQYNWTAGAVDVNIGVFTALDLVDDGIYGDYYVNPLSYVNLTNSTGYVDLNGNLIMLGGEFNVYGGTADSYFAYSNPAGIYMTAGIVDFHDVGVFLSNSYNAFSSIITGGTLRTGKNFDLNHSGFAPSGLTLEFAGSDNSYIYQYAGSLNTISLNKTSPTATLSPATNIALSNNLNILQGLLIVEDKTLNISGNLNVTSGIHVNHQNAVIRVSGNTVWNAGSLVAMNANGTFQSAGNWTFDPGTNVQFNDGIVNFIGTSNSYIFSNSADSYFNQLLCSKSSGATVTLSNLSQANCNVKNDFYIFSGNSFLGESSHPLVFEGAFINNGHYRFNAGEVSLMNASFPITPGSGDYFNQLTLNSPGTFNFNNTFSDTLNVKGNFTINAGGLNMNNKILAFGGFWNNLVGESGFAEGAGKVIASGGGIQQILNSEIFYNFEINSLYPTGYYADVQLGNNLNLNVLHNFNIEQGTLWLYNNNNLVVGNNLGIASGSGLSANNGSNIAINLAGNLTDDNAGFNTYFGFNPGASSVFTLNGSSDQHLYTSASASETFHHISINKPAGMVLPSGDLTVKGNFEMVQGSFNNSNPDLDFTFFGNLTTAPGTNFYPGGRTIFAGGNDQEISLSNTSYFEDVLVQKELATNTVTQLTEMISINGNDLNVGPGTLNLNGHYFRCTGNVDIFDNGKILMSNDTWLEVGPGNTLTVNNGGLLQIIGSVGHLAKITRNNIGNFNFNVENGGTLSANHAIFEYTGTYGVNIKTGAMLDGSNNLSNCIFRYGAAGGRLLTINNSQDMEISNAVFTSNSTGCVYNVSKTSNLGSIRFIDATGDFSGDLYEEDNYGRVIWGWPPKSLTVNVMLEGLFNHVSNTLNKARNATGEEYPGDVADKINIELHSASSYPTIVYSATDVDLSTNGTAELSTIPGTLSGSYYISVKHRNSVETVSANPVSFSGINANYNFTENSAQAYNDNLKMLAPGIYGIYAGNVNADGQVDDLDINLIQSSASTFSLGYLLTDVNGDGIVDAMDLIMTDNNAANFIMVRTP